MELKSSNIKYLIVHHSATARDTTTFEAVKKYHISKGWGDIGYHFFITPDGKVMPGRTENTIGAHCQADSMNFKSLGICLPGNFMTEVPTVQQLTSLLELLKKLMSKYNIPKENVLGHREVSGASTACPGDNFQKWVSNFRGQNSESDRSAIAEQVMNHLEQAIEKLKQLL
ncbi:MAG: peptidoglycan recognition family protein [Candidatus Marinimicrobia bacterium]|nr:peptidoglycan recognition family protein [Candidatus Neomarinimicrobiota bacterium]